MNKRRGPTTSTTRVVMQAPACSASPGTWFRCAREKKSALLNRCTGETLRARLCSLKSATRNLLLVVIAFASVSTARAADFYSDGVKIHYTVQGAGQPVLLIHGLGASAARNWDQPGITASLAQRYRVITLDCRGHGESDKPEAEGSYGVKMVEDVVRLLNHLGISETHMVGYSMGGMITMKLLTMHPRRVRSAVLGGMGWFREGSLAQQFVALGSPWGSAPQACVRELAQLAVTEAEVRAIHTPVTVIVGTADPLKFLFVDPLGNVRPDWPVHLVDGAGHIDCVIRPEFKAFLQSALDEAPVVEPRRRRESRRAGIAAW